MNDNNGSAGDSAQQRIPDVPVHGRNQQHMRGSGQWKRVSETIDHNEQVLIVFVWDVANKRRSDFVPVHQVNKRRPASELCDQQPSQPEDSDPVLNRNTERSTLRLKSPCDTLNHPVITD